MTSGNNGSTIGPSNEPVTDKICIERIENIKTAIRSSETRVLGKINGIAEKIDIVINHHKERIDSNEDEIGETAKKMAEVEIQTERVLQWKEDGEKKRDITVKTMTIFTGLAIVIVSLLSNLARIITFIVKIAATKP